MPEFTAAFVWHSSCDALSPVRLDEESTLIRRRVLFGVAIAIGLLFGALAAIVATWGME